MINKIRMKSKEVEKGLQCMLHCGHSHILRIQARCINAEAVCGQNLMLA